MISLTLGRPEFYIDADDDTLAGEIMNSQDWGSATSIPPKVELQSCRPPLTSDPSNFDDAGFFVNTTFTG